MQIAGNAIAYHDGSSVSPIPSISIYIFGERIFSAPYPLWIHVLFEFYFVSVSKSESDL